MDEKLRGELVHLLNKITWVDSINIDDWNKYERTVRVSKDPNEVYSACCHLRIMWPIRRWVHTFEEVYNRIDTGVYPGKRVILDSADPGYVSRGEDRALNGR